MSAVYVVLWDHKEDALYVATEEAAINDAMGKFLDNVSPMATLRNQLTRQQAEAFIRNYRHVTKARGTHEHSTIR